MHPSFVSASLEDLGLLSSAEIMASGRNEDGGKTPTWPPALSHPSHSFVTRHSLPSGPIHPPSHRHSNPDLRPITNMIEGVGIHYPSNAPAVRFPPTYPGFQVAYLQMSYVGVTPPHHRHAMPCLYPLSYRLIPPNLSGYLWPISSPG